MRIIFLMFIFSQISIAGNELGNGGDSYAQEFVTIGRRLVTQLKENPDQKIADLPAFTKAVDETRVVTKDSLDLKAAEVDALNFPEEKRIEVNRVRWKDYSEEQKTTLVLHEYLGVSKVANDSNYQVSSSYVDSGLEIKSKIKYIKLGIHSGYSSSFLKEKPSRPFYGASLAYLASENFQVFGAIDSYKFSDSYTWDDGALGYESLMKYSAGARYELPLTKRWRPFFVGNLNYYKSDFETKTSDSFMTTTNEMEDMEKWGIGVGAGISYKVNRELDLDFGLNVDIFGTLHGEPAPSPLSAAHLGLAYNF